MAKNAKYLSKPTSQSSTAAVSPLDEETQMETQIESEAQTLAEVIDTVAAPIVAEAPVAVEDTAPTKAVVIEDYSAVTDVVAELKQYVLVMAPGTSHVGNTGINAQVQLYHTIKNVLQSSGARFEQGMQLLIKTFAEHRDGCMGPRYLFRYMPNLPLPPSARNEMTRLLNLFSAASIVPGNRAMVTKSVDVVGTVATFSGDVQSRVLEYFKV